MTDARDPRAIEANIHQTQTAISHTTDRLAQQLSPIELLKSFTGGGSSGSNQTLERVKRQAADNPLALALIGAGAAWLFTGPDAKPFTFTSDDDENDGKDRLQSGMPTTDPYLAHMSAVQRRDDEPEKLYQRRRDDARATYYRVERDTDEDDKSFRDRLNAASAKLEGKRAQATERASELAEQARERRRAAAAQAKSSFDDNPLLGGLLAMFAGAVAGASAPVTSRERGAVSDHAAAVRKKIENKAKAAARIAEDQVHPDRENPVTIGDS